MKVTHPGCSLPVAFAVAAISLSMPAKVYTQTRPGPMLGPQHEDGVFDRLERRVGATMRAAPAS